MKFKENTHDNNTASKAGYFQSTSSSDIMRENHFAAPKRDLSFREPGLSSIFLSRITQAKGEPNPTDIQANRNYQAVQKLMQQHPLSGSVTKQLHPYTAQPSHYA